MNGDLTGFTSLDLPRLSGASYQDISISEEIVKIDILGGELRSFEKSHIFRGRVRLETELR